MNLIAISRVKNELDIIEAFVRHHAHYFDTLIVLDNGSTDGTYEVLRSLQTAGLPLVLLRDLTVGFEQSRHMTSLLHMAVNDFHADWVVPLDADEFIEPEAGASLGQMLHARDGELLTISWSNFAWRPEDDAQTERNPVLRMRWRMPPSPDSLAKVLLPAKLVAGTATELEQGNHGAILNGQKLPAQPLRSMPLCHFPIRSAAQYASKIAVAYLQYAATPGWNRHSGFHYIEPFRLLTQGLDRLVQTMPVISRRYSMRDEEEVFGEPVEAPLRYQGGPLSLTTSRDTMLANVLHCAEAIANQAAERPKAPAIRAPRSALDRLRREVGRILRQLRRFARRV
jgi:glycosyltransferase involved in cell wall biosynthesis